MMNLNKRIPHTKQQGIALIFVLLILVVVSLLGIGGAQLALLGERGARNERDMQVSRQSAEAALQDAEFDIRGPGSSTRKTIFDSPANFTLGCGTVGDLQGLCEQNVTGKPTWLAVDFLDKSEQKYTLYGTKTNKTFAVGNGIQPALVPRYIVELLPDSSTGNERGLKAEKKVLYRVTSMGFGPREDIRTVLQMVFRKEKI
jgi:type IV pilus assembly protein PilX